MTSAQDQAQFEEDIDVPQPTADAIGKASEALEYIERARGHLYTFHQLLGRADILFSESVELLRTAGLDDEAEHIDSEIVGRNVLDGRWTFQVVEEFDALYYTAIVDSVRAMERDHQNGRRHVYEARLKERGRSRSRPGHEHRPPAAHDPRIETDAPAT
jgi:hypothetical protein